MSGMEFAAASALMQMQASQVKARGLAAQGAYARIEARQASIQYKQQAVSVLDNILNTSAEVTARAAAGGVDPFSGSAGELQTLAMAKGAQELYTIKDNAVLALAGGDMQSQQFGLQATAARQEGFAAAFGQLGQAEMTQKAIG